MGLKLEIILLIENLNNAYRRNNRIPELVEKKDPPIIDNIKNMKERFGGVFVKETPMLEILLIIDNKI